MKYKLLRTKALFEIFLVITITFSVYMIAEAKPVNAQAGCCEKLGDKWCQPATQTCDSNYAYVPGVSSCAETTMCKPGTCFINNQCFANYPRSQCANLGGQWFDKSVSQVPDCSPGCCIVGNNCQLAIQSKCEEITPDDISLNYISGMNNERECILKCIGEDKGCCVYGEQEKAYSYATRAQCDNLGGEFRFNAYCSSIEGSNCKPGNHTGCVDGDDNLYSFDSCGNREGIKQECNYPDELCGADINDQDNDGDKEESVCRSLSCPNTYDNLIMDNDGGIRKNGESWCEYPSATGPGLDLPGSIHYKHSCIAGVEYAENCGNDRDEMCVYGEFTNMQGLPEENFLSGLPDMEFAFCKENRAEDCAEQNKRKDCENLEERDCVWLDNKTDTGKKCLPLVPPGFTKEERGGEEAIADDLCKKGNFKIDILWTAYYECSGTDCRWVWHCSENCGAFDGKTLKATNLYCMAQGDCGASPNIAGEFTEDGYKRKCKAGMPSGEKRKPNCISKFTENLWHKYYDDITLKLKGKGLNVESVDAKAYWDYVAEAGTAGGEIGFYVGLTIGILGAPFTGGQSLWLAPIGYIVGGILGWIVGMVIGALEKQKVKILPIKCKPWEIPEGGEDCWKCFATQLKGGLLPDKNGVKLEGYECQPYTCETLGTACKYIQNTIDQGPACVKADCRDLWKPPIIIPDNDSLASGNLACCTQDSEQKICNPIDCGLNNKGANIGYDITGNVNELKTFSFGIKTVDETEAPLYTTCSYSDEPSTQITEEGETISGMDLMDALSEGLPGTQHNITVPAGYLASMGENETFIYIKCQNAIEDACATPLESPTDYRIKFSIHTGPDTTVPIIEYIEPASQFVAYDKDTKELTLHINEVLTWNNILQKTGGCRWSDQNVIYDLMSPENDTLCHDPDIYEDQKCSIELTGIKPGSNAFYFACVDPAGNNGTAYPYLLIRTGSLNISSLKVMSGDCISYGSETKCYTNNISLKAETIGGAESGKSECSWSDKCSEDTCMRDLFFNTNSIIHEQPNLMFNTGSYEYYARCVDIAENIATESVKFSIEVDTEPPKLVGISHDMQYNKLKIIVNDVNAVKCEYSDKQFFLGQGTNMNNIGNAFFAEWGLGLYYIRCEDKFGNEMLPLVVHTSNL